MISYRQADLLNALEGHDKIKSARDYLLVIKCIKTHTDPMNTSRQLEPQEPEATEGLDLLDPDVQTGLSKLRQHLPTVYRILGYTLTGGKYYSPVTGNPNSSLNKLKMALDDLRVVHSCKITRSFYKDVNNKDVNNVDWANLVISVYTK